MWYMICGCWCRQKVSKFRTPHFLQVTQPTSWHRATSSEGVLCYGAMTDRSRNQDTKKGFESESFFHWTRNLHLCRSQGISTLNQVGRTQDRNRARNWCHYCTFGIQVGMVLLGSTGWPKSLSFVNGQGKCGPNLYACVATALRLFNCQCHCQGPQQWKSKAAKHTLNRTNETRDVPAGPETMKKTSIVSKNTRGLSSGLIPRPCSGSESSLSRIRTA